MRPATMIGTIFTSISRGVSRPLTTAVALPGLSLMVLMPPVGLGDRPARNGTSVLLPPRGPERRPVSLPSCCPSAVLWSFACRSGEPQDSGNGGGHRGGPATWTRQETPPSCTVSLGATPFLRDLAKSSGGLCLQESLWLPRQGCV